jgi:hypothetical protein
MNMKDRIQSKQKFYSKTSIAYSENYGCAAILESALEIDYFNWRDFENDKDFFEMQPEKLVYKVDGRERRYTPDAMYVLDCEKTIEEVKYVTEANEPDNIQKHKLLEKIYAENNIKFNVVTEIEIRIGDRATNLRYLRPALPHPKPIEELQNLLKHTSKKSMHISKFIEFQKQFNAKDCLVRRAIAHKLLLCDLTEPYDSLVLSWEKMETPTQLSDKSSANLSPIHNVQGK